MGLRGIRERQSQVADYGLPLRRSEATLGWRDESTWCCHVPRSETPTALSPVSSCLRVRIRAFTSVCSQRPVRSPAALTSPLATALTPGACRYRTDGCSQRPLRQAQHGITPGRAAFVSPRTCRECSYSPRKAVQHGRRQDHAQSLPATHLSPGSMEHQHLRMKNREIWHWKTQAVNPSVARSHQWCEVAVAVVEEDGRLSLARWSQSTAGNNVVLHHLWAI